MKKANHLEIGSKTIPHSRPTIGKQEVDAVGEVVASGQLAQGDRVASFETALGDFVGVPHAAAVSSGTSAIFLTLEAMDIGNGDEVILPSFVCTALLNAVQLTGATPVLADIEAGGYNMDPADAESRLTPKTKAIIVPHMFGAPAELEKLIALGIPVIEDCAQAVGATFSGKPVGSLGHAAVFSFYATKVMTTGEGGMVVSHSEDLVERIKNIREYDNRNSREFCFNFKMTDIQAAMGLVQLARLPALIQRRRQIAHVYQNAFRNMTFLLPPMEPGHIFYRYVLAVKAGNTDTWIDYLGERNVSCAKPVFQPIHVCQGQRGYPRTEQAWRTALSIPIFPSLTDEDVTRIVDEVIRAGRKISSNE